MPVHLGEMGRHTVGHACHGVPGGSEGQQIDVPRAAGRELQPKWKKRPAPLAELKSDAHTTLPSYKCICMFKGMCWRHCPWLPVAVRMRSGGRAGRKGNKMAQERSLGGTDDREPGSGKCN